MKELLDTIERNWNIWHRLVEVCIRKNIHVTFFGIKGIILSERNCNDKQRKIIKDFQEVLNDINRENFGLVLKCKNWGEDSGRSV